MFCYSITKWLRHQASHSWHMRNIRSSIGRPAQLARSWWERGHGHCVILCAISLAIYTTHAVLTAQTPSHRWTPFAAWEHCMGRQKWGQGKSIFSGKQVSLSSSADGKHHFQARRWTHTSNTVLVFRMWSGLSGKSDCLECAHDSLALSSC